MPLISPNIVDFDVIIGYRTKSPLNISVSEDRYKFAIDDDMTFFISLTPGLETKDFFIQGVIPGTLQYDKESNTILLNLLAATPSKGGLTFSTYGDIPPGDYHFSLNVDDVNGETVLRGQGLWRIRSAEGTLPRVNAETIILGPDIENPNRSRGIGARFNPFWSPKRLKDIGIKGV